METKRRRLLLADDSLTIQKVIQLTFSDEGMDVTTVGAGDEAIRVIEESGPPDVVLADVHMPGLSGYEVCERIKQDARWRHVPVVLLAGAFEPFDEAEARRVGADEVLTKPFQSIRDLIGKVGSLFGGRSGADEARERRDETALRDSEARARSAAAQGGVGAEPSRAAETQARADSFADFGMDDQMIEATPAEAFEPGAEQHQSAAAREAVYVEEAESVAWAGEQPEAQPFAAAAPQEARVEARAEARAAQPAFASYAASAATAGRPG